MLHGVRHALRGGVGRQGDGTGLADRKGIALCGTVCDHGGIGACPVVKAVAGLQRRRDRDGFAVPIGAAAGDRGDARRVAVDKLHGGGGAVVVQIDLRAAVARNVAFGLLLGGGQPGGAVYLAAVLIFKAGDALGEIGIKRRSIGGAGLGVAGRRLEGVIVVVDILQVIVDRVRRVGVRSGVGGQGRAAACGVGGIRIGSARTACNSRRIGAGPVFKRVAGLDGRGHAAGPLVADRTAAGHGGDARPRRRGHGRGHAVIVQVDLKGPVRGDSSRGDVGRGAVERTVAVGKAGVGLLLVGKRDGTVHVAVVIRRGLF